VAQEVPPYPLFIDETRGSTTISFFIDEARVDNNKVISYFFFLFSSLEITG
jgi:hypothetical protein